MTQPEALRLADALTTQPDCNCYASSYFECACDAIWPEQWIDSAAAELRRIQAQMTACEPYLKEGETPAERIERDHRDSLALMTLLAREKTKNEALLEALKELMVAADGVNAGPQTWLTRARAAIKAAEEKNKYE